MPLTRDEALYWLNADTSTPVALRHQLRALSGSVALLVAENAEDTWFLRGVEAGIRAALQMAFDVKQDELHEHVVPLQDSKPVPVTVADGGIAMQSQWEILVRDLST